MNVLSLTKIQDPRIGKMFTFSRSVGTFRILLWPQQFCVCVCLTFLGVITLHYTVYAADHKINSKYTVYCTNCSSLPGVVFKIYFTKISSMKCMKWPRTLLHLACTPHMRSTVQCAGDFTSSSMLQLPRLCALRGSLVNMNRTVLQILLFFRRFIIQELFEHGYRLLVNIQNKNQTKGKAKVVATGWGTEFKPFTARMI